MLRQRTTSNVAGNTAEQLANKGTAALNEAAPNGLVALYDSEEEERGRATRTNLVKLNKLKMLRDLANRKRLDVIHIAETHDQNPVARGPLKEWHSTPFISVGGRHGTVMLIATAPESVKAETNVAASCINWEGQHIWLISAYFLNSLEETNVTLRA
jgi:hypothetical protein